MVSIAVTKHRKLYRMNDQKRRYLIGGLAAVTLLTFGFLSSPSPDQFYLLELEELPSTTNLTEISAFSTCGVNATHYPVVPPATTITNEHPKPFWLSSYPSSGAGLIGNLVRALSGNVHGAHKSYYAKSKQVKKCFGGAVPTVTCEQIHPVVSIGPKPENQAHKFQPHILLSLRSPVTVAPASFQEKAERYHHQAHGTQVSVNSWRKYRDDWLQNGVYDGWENVTTTWHDMYEGIALYLPLEHVVHPVQGPVLAQRLAQVLREAGFAVVADEHVSCVWYHTIGEHYYVSAKGRPMLYEFASDYVPAYTQEQKSYLVDRMESLRARYPDDVALGEILTEYTTSIIEDPSFDKPWTNTTGNDGH